MVKKKIIVFGAGKYFDNYMTCYGLTQKPYWIVDNNEKLQGTSKYGIEIHAVEELLSMPKSDFYVIICTAKAREIMEQLKSFGIVDCQIYYPMDTQSICYMDEKLMNKEKYQIGYVPGVFDLFHIGHLNLLHKSKMRCEYLIAGVLTDELVFHFKGRYPVIPYAQRAAIVSAIEYADRVIPVTFDNTRKIDAWQRIHFDCHFSGNDHGADWSEDLRALQAVGANMEFFGYTPSISSTDLRAELRKNTDKRHLNEKN